jgi:hypothetical protein
MASRPSEHELGLIKEIRMRIQDVGVDEEYLQAKNLVRFLRARRLDVNLTEDMIRKHVEWMREVQLDTVMEYDPCPEFKSNFPWFLVGYDNLGGPLAVINMGKWNIWKISGMKDDAVRLFLQYFETCWRVMKMKSKGRDSIPQFTVIVDCEGLCWKHYTCYEGVQAVLTMFKYFEANYPETMRRGIFVNTPSVFSIFWKTIKPLMSHETIAKFQILGSNKNEWIKEISKCAKLDQVPQKYGGTLPDNYQIPTDDLKNSYISQNGNECTYGL